MRIHHHDSAVCLRPSFPIHVCIAIVKDPSSHCPHILRRGISESEVIVKQIDKEQRATPQKEQKNSFVTMTCFSLASVVSAVRRTKMIAPLRPLVNKKVGQRFECSFNSVLCYHTANLGKRECVFRSSIHTCFLPLAVLPTF